MEREDAMHHDAQPAGFWPRHLQRWLAHAPAAPQADAPARTPEPAAAEKAPAN